MVSLVIPAYNEERRLAPTLSRVVSYLAARGEPFEVIVVDDGSADGTAAVAEAWSGAGVRLLAGAPNRGKGDAVRRGILTTRGDAVLVTDADLSTPIEQLEPLLAALNAGADVVLGSRALPDSRITLRQPFYRERMGKTFNLAVRALLGFRYRDTQCGFKLFRGDAARRLFSHVRERGFGFDVEVIHLARRCGYAIAEVPVEWRNSPDSRVHLVRSSADMLVSLGRVVLRDRAGRYRRAVADVTGSTRA